jgi:cysteine desulfuration protein SufE
MNTQETQDKIVREFQLFQDWTERYEHIIRLGKKLPEMDVAQKTDENRIIGCQSAVWLTASEKDHLLHFQADSDALIVKGLIALLLRVYNDRTPDEILHTEPDFISKIGLDRHLSPTRSNGLVAMMAKIKSYARAHLEPSGS